MNGNASTKKTVSEHVICEYLKGEYLNRFNEIRSKVQIEFANILSSVDKSVKIPYIPRLYVLPFVVTKVQRRGSIPFKLTYYNLMYIDPEEFERYAIFSSLDFLEKFQEYIAGGLGHEIVHFLRVGGKVSLNRKDLYQVWKDPYHVEINKEKTGEGAYGFFAEPIKSTIRKWNKLSACPEIGNELVYGAEVVDFKTFEEFVFGDKQKEFREFIRRKLKETGF